MNAPQPPGTLTSTNKSKPRSRRGTVGGVILLVLLAAYASAIILGRVPADRRIDTPALGIIVAGCLIALLLVRPELLERITRLEALEWKVEMENRQQQQSVQLKDLELILPLLLPATERHHLTNLANGTTANYCGNHELRTELRRLRSIKLIEMLPEQHVSMLTDGSVFDLARYIRLTKLGVGWAERLKQLDSEVGQEAQAASW
jgi:hypothetical protein